MQLYKLEFKVKLLIVMGLILLLSGEWFFFKMLAECQASDFFSVASGGQGGLYSLLFSGLSFLTIIFLFKGFLFQYSDVDSFYRYPALIVYLFGISVFMTGIFKSDPNFLQASGFLLGLPSLFMSVVIFKQVLNIKKEKGDQYEETSS